MPTFPPSLRHGTGATLTLEADLAVVASRPEARAAATSLDDLLASAGLTPMASPSGSSRSSATSGGRALSRVNDSEELRWVRLAQQRQLPTAAAGILDRLGDRAEWLGAVYRFPDVPGDQGLVCPLPDVLLVRPVESVSDDALRERLAGFGLVEDEQRSRYTTPYRYVRVQDARETNAYELQTSLLADASDVVAEVRLETMPMLVPSTLSPNDPLFAEQWGIKRIQAPQAWDVSQGSAGTVICILDEGCDLSHPDLRFADRGINLGTMRPDGRPTGDHGTACAGIAAAVVGNQAGVAGVAGGCPILPLAFQNWSDVECAAGIRYAADHGASVVSMSFGVYAPGENQGPVGWDFSLIDPAIAYAHSRGVILCAATGNEDVDTFNRYPSRHPLVIAVGASDQADNRKSLSSPDGEDYWGSNYAPGVSVVAPGVLIATTDRRGSAGYNGSSGGGGDYYTAFNGTSSATPHVAGLAALLRSLDPTLSTGAVRDILERTAAKVGELPYAVQSEFPNGTRNDAMGYGRIDALAAVRAAVPQLYRAPTSTAHDLTGDGRADLVGFGHAGVQVALNAGNGTFAAPVLAVSDFGYSQGWRVQRHPRLLADLTGDGRADVVGFGGAGVLVALNRGDGSYRAPVLAVPDLGYGQGWRVEKHPRFLADVTGDGCADVVGFGETGVWVAVNRGDGTFKAPKLVLKDYGHSAGGWRLEKHPRLLADLTGDGRADLVGFGSAGVLVALNRGDGTYQAPVLAVSDFGHGQGWRIERHPRFLADLTGDGRADLVGFGGAGVYVALNRGDGTFRAPVLAVPDFGYDAGGWRVEKHPRMLADVTGDGRADVVGFGGAGVHVALNRGDGTFRAPVLAAPDLGYGAGWRVEKHARFLADLTGDGRADVVGFGDGGTYVGLNPGTGTFAAPALVLEAFGIGAGGWRVERHPRVAAGPGSVGI